MPRPTVARIHSGRLQHNLARARELAPGSRIMACVKANGYGHGLVPVARALEPVCHGLAVATLEEAITLREASIGTDILLLEGVHAPGDWSAAARHRLSVAVSDLSQLAWLEAASLPDRVTCWVKVDTGMHRLGVGLRQLHEALGRLRQHQQVAPAITLMTHFASADEPASTHTLQQLRAFIECSDDLGLARSCANSAAILSLPDSHLDWVRPGYMLYGGSPFAGRSAADCGLQPVMEFTSQVISVREVPAGDGVGYGGRWVATRDSRLATVAAGYGDGYPRHAPDGTPVLIAGQRRPLAGRVSMDMLSVDVTDAPETAVGSPVTLWGEGLPVDDIARRAGTIGYELLAAMPARVTREICP